MKSIKVKGLAKLQARVNKPMNMAEVARVVTSNGAMLTQKAQERAPVDTGFLKRSITMSVESGNKRVTATIKAYAEYAPYVEFGTRFNRAQPFMRPAYNIQKVQFKKDMEALMK